jgi:hypothetical protein
LKRTPSLLILMLAGLTDTAHSAKKQPTEQHVHCSSVPTVTPVAGATAHVLWSSGVLPFMPPLETIVGEAGICTDQAEPSPAMAVTVRLLDIYTAHRAVLSQATAIAAKMFSAAGVRIEWRYQYSSRGQSGLDGDPVVRMFSHTPATYRSRHAGLAAHRHASIHAGRPSD